MAALATSIAAASAGGTAPATFIPVLIVSSSFLATVLIDRLNVASHEFAHIVTDRIDFHQSIYGSTQSKPLLREARASLFPIDHMESNDAMSDQDWQKIPHIYQICQYAHDRDVLLSYYWTGRFIVLNKLYLDWLHTIPIHSPIHDEGNYAQVFVELHLHLFTPGLRGRFRSTFKF